MKCFCKVFTFQHFMNSKGLSYHLSLSSSVIQDELRVPFKGSAGPGIKKAEEKLFHALLAVNGGRQTALRSFH